MNLSRLGEKSPPTTPISNSYSGDERLPAAANREPSETSVLGITTSQKLEASFLLPQPVKSNQTPLSVLSGFLPSFFSYRPPSPETSWKESFEQVESPTAKNGEGTPPFSQKAIKEQKEEDQQMLASFPEGVSEWQQILQKEGIKLQNLAQELQEISPRKRAIETKINDVEEEYQLYQKNLTQKQSLFELMIKDAEMHLNIMIVNLTSYQRDAQPFFENPSTKLEERDLFSQNLKNHREICEHYESSLSQFRVALENINQEREEHTLKYQQNRNIEQQKKETLQKRETYLAYQLQAQKEIFNTLSQGQDHLEDQLRKTTVTRLLYQQLQEGISFSEKEQQPLKIPQKTIYKGTKLLYLIENPFYADPEEEKKEISYFLAHPLIKHVYGKSLESLFLEKFSSKEPISTERLCDFLIPYTIFLPAQLRENFIIQKTIEISSPWELYHQKDIKNLPAPPQHQLRLSEEVLSNIGHSDIRENLSLPQRVFLIRSNTQCERLTQLLRENLQKKITSVREPESAVSETTENLSSPLAEKIFQWAQEKKLSIDWPRFALSFAGKRVEFSDCVELTEVQIKYLIEEIKLLLLSSFSIKMVQQLLLLLNSENRIAGFPTGEENITGFTLAPSFIVSQSLDISYAQEKLFLVNTYYGDNGKAINTIYSPKQNITKPHIIFFQEGVPHSSLIRRSVITLDPMKEEVEVFSSMEAVSIGELLPSENS